jgi:hypothetical protein
MDISTTTTPGLGDERARVQRVRLRSRHAQGLTTLMDARADLRGVHALADFVDDAVRWSV